MAADLGIGISINATDAINQAKQLGDSLTKMGAAGDTGAQKVADAGKKMSGAMKDATTAAAAANNMFTALQASASKSVGGSSAANMMPMLQALEKAKIFYQGINEQAAQTASLGGKQAQAFNQAAAAAKGMTDALTSTRQMVSEMVAEGTKMDDVFGALKEQIQMIQSPMAGIGAEAKNAFQTIEAGLTKTIGTTKEFQNANKAVEQGFTQEVAAAQKAEAAKEALRQKEAAAAEKAAAKEAADVQAAIEKEIAAIQKREAADEASQRRMATRHGATSAAGQGPMGAATGAMMNLAMGGQMLSSGGAMGSLMGIQQLSAGMVEAGAAAGTFGVAFGGLVAVLAAGIAVITAVGAAFKLMQDAIKQAGEEEKLSIQLKNIYGSAKQAGAAMDELKTFSQSATGGMFNLSDLVAGQKQLLLLTGGFINLKEVMPEVANAAAESGKSFDAEASQVARVYSAIQTGNPVRAQLIQQLVGEGAISEATRVKIENMAKAHKSAADILKTFVTGLKEGGSAAEEMGNTVEGLGNRIQKAFDQDFLAPLGAAFEPVLKKIEAGILGLLQGHDADIKAFADTIQYDLLFAFNYVSDQGIVKSMQDAFSAIGDYIKANMGKWLGDAVSQAFNNWKTAWAVLLGWLGDQINAIFAAAGKIVKAFQESSTGQGPGQASTAADKLAAAQGNLQMLQQGGASDQQILDAQKAVDDAQKESAKELNDAAAKLKDSSENVGPALVKTAADVGNAIANAFVNNPALKSFQQGYGGTGAVGAATAFASPVAGATPGVRAMQYGPVVGEYTHATNYGPDNKPLGPNDIAVSQQLMNQFGLKMHDIVNILDQNGKVLLANQRIADTSWKNGPNGIPIDTGGFETRQGKELGYASLQKTIYAQPDTSAPTSTAQLEAIKTHNQMVQQQNADAQKSKGLLGTPPGTVDPTQKKAKGEWQDLSADINKVSEAERNATAMIKLYDAEVKAGQISATEANALKLAAYDKEKQALQSLIPLLEQQKVKADAAHNPAKVEEVASKLVDLKTKLLEIQQAEDAIKGKQPWDAFVTGVKEAVAAAGTLTQQFTNLGKSVTDNFATGFASAFTSITDGSKTAKQAFLDFAKSFLDQIEQMVLKMVIFNALSTVLGSIGGGAGATTYRAGMGYTYGAAPGAQSGGTVVGPSGNDAVFMRLTAGEFVMRKSAVDSLGTEFLHSLNRSAGAKGMAAGGLVSAGTGPMNVPPSQSGGSAGGTTISTVVNMGNSQGGQQGPSQQDAAQFQKILTAQIKQVITTEKRPGGSLNKNSY